MLARQRFGIKRKEFLFMTFREFNILNILWLNDKREDLKSIFESMRYQTYFTFMLNVDKKHKKGFKQFCREYMPFNWDKFKKSKALILNEANWNEIEKLHGKSVNAKEVSLEKIEGLIT